MKIKSFILALSLFAVSCNTKPSIISEIFSHSNTIDLQFIGFRYSPWRITDREYIQKLSTIFSHCSNTITDSLNPDKYFGSLTFYADSQVLEKIFIGNTKFYLAVKNRTFRHHNKDIISTFRNGFFSNKMQRGDSTIKVLFPPKDIFSLSATSIGEVKEAFQRDHKVIIELFVLQRANQLAIDTVNLNFVRPFRQFPLDFAAATFYDSTYDISSLAFSSSQSIGFFLESAGRIIARVSYTKRNGAWDYNNVDVVTDTVTTWFLKKYSNRQIALLDGWMYGNFITIEDKDTANLFSPEGPVRICSPLKGLICADKTISAFRFVLKYKYPKCI
jgi:hypothetical protein